MAAGSLSDTDSDSDSDCVSVSLMWQLHKDSVVALQESALQQNEIYD